MSESPEPRKGMHRFTSPTVEQFEQAAEVCYVRWPYMRELDSPARFRAFQELKVELCCLTDANGAMQCVGFLIPGETEIGGEVLRWHHMFQICSRPDAPGAGALLVRQIMKWYPAIFGVGITPDAKKLYDAFRWTYYPDFWRGVHLLNVSRLAKDYSERILNSTKRSLFVTSSGLLTAIGAVVDFALALGMSARPWQPASGKGAAVRSHLALFESGPVRAADVGGAGRLLTPVGTGGIFCHAAVWRALRRNNARFCEALICNRGERMQAILRGYIPIGLQVWCWDPTGVLARAIPILRQRGFTFLDTDKVL